MGVTVVVGPASKAGAAGKNYAGVLLQYPSTDGSVVSYGVFSITHAWRLTPRVCLCIVLLRFASLINGYVRLCILHPCVVFAVLLA